MADCAQDYDYKHGTEYTQRCCRCGTIAVRSEFSGLFCRACRKRMRTIADFPEYAIEDDGTVWRLQYGHKRESKDGVRITLSKDGKPATRSIGKLVMTAFGGSPPAGAVNVQHKDGNPANNTVANLSWKLGPDSPRPPRFGADGTEYRQVTKHPAYMVGDNGDVFHADTGRKPKRDRTYQYVRLDSGPDGKCLIAELVLWAFRGGPRAGQTTPCWIDGDKTNNRLDNLIWSDGGPAKRLYKKLSGEPRRRLLPQRGWCDISDHGKVFDRPTGEEQPLTMGDDGRVKLVYEEQGFGKRITKSIDIADSVLEAFGPRRPYEDAHAIHLDQNKQNNRADNLEWA